VIEKPHASPALTTQSPVPIASMADYPSVTFDRGATYIEEASGLEFNHPALHSSNELLAEVF
jgi:hypothetical protein